MTPTFNIALSGLSAASKKFEVYAKNIANQSSTSTNRDGVVTNEPYHAQVPQQVSNVAGGVSVVVNDKNPPTIRVQNPNADNADANGFSEIPNVDLAEELVGIKLASYDFKANLKVIEKENENANFLFRIIG